MDLIPGVGSGMEQLANAFPARVPTDERKPSHSPISPIFSAWKR